ncbi:MAG TPA: hypothetical protein VEJ84_24795 [Acidimicrobiales bacterium]|nr:hypothetical protein [Acidimicrobiales bacterium]
MTFEGDITGDIAEVHGAAQTHFVLENVMPDEGCSVLAFFGQ